MYVICDIEWVEHYSQRIFPTQIAAIKVDSEWNAVSDYSSFISPPERIKYNKKHMAFRGGDISDFESSKNAQQVFEMFYEWLDEDDILLWWADQSDGMFRIMTKMFMTDQSSNKSVVIFDHVKAVLEDRNLQSYSLFSVAEYLELPVKQYIKHHSIHDAAVMLDVLKALKYPQNDLIPNRKKENCPSVTKYRFVKFPYYYDHESGLIHNSKCDKLLYAGIDITGYPTLVTAVKRKYKPCECCREEYKQTRRDKNADTISRSSYNYVFSPNSDIYHKRECRLVLNSTCVLGAHTVEAVLKTDRKPCKICNPPSEVDLNKKRKRPKKKKIIADTRKERDVEETYKPLPFIADKDQLRAVNRQKVAAKERADKLRDGLSQDELNNIYALTQPRYAFWAAKGHKHFHLRSCPTMKNLSHLRGFETYQDAIKARFVPCRHCKPTSKHDLKLSVPIYSQLRENESINEIKLLCIEEGFECFEENEVIHVNTPVGKWLIHTKSVPIQLEHINLNMYSKEPEYHTQHRLLLSFYDAFRYIKQHDNNLI